MQPKEIEQILGSPVSVDDLPDEATARAQPARGPSPLTWLTMAVAILAFAWRLWSVLRGGGLNGVFGYDDGVYYTGADALVSGRVPYRDFVLLHPPGILLVLAPFAALGHLLSDPTGFALARAFFMLVGALNAALLTRIAGRLSLVAAAVAGLSYAAWFPSMYAERTTLLEPLGTTGLLFALLMLFHARERSGRGQVLAGVALGLAAGVKIWGVVPALVIVLWQWRESGWRVSSRVASGAALGVVGVCLPFFLLAPGSMFRMVVLAQVSRPVSKTSRLSRLVGMSSLDPMADWGRLPLGLAVGAVGALILGATIYAWLQGSSRIVVVLLVTMGLVIMAGPSYFGHYGEFVAGPLALTFGVAAHRLVDWGRRRQGAMRAVTIAAVVAPLTVLAVGASNTTFGRPIAWPGRELAGSVAGCVVSDVPTGLIELNVLTSDLQQSCPVWVDVSGLTYLDDAKRGPSGHAMNRLENLQWQADLMRYFTSGSATVLLRSPSQELSPHNLTRLKTLPLLAKKPSYRIYGRP